MNTPDPTHPRPSAADPAVRDVLMELAGYGLRIARVAAEVAEVEGRVVALLATGLPDEYGNAASLHDGQMAGLAVDAADLALKEASPRIDAAGQTFERVSRAVRRTVALVQRIEAGWPRGWRRTIGGRWRGGRSRAAWASGSPGTRTARRRSGCSTICMSGWTRWSSAVTWTSRWTW